MSNPSVQRIDFAWQVSEDSLERSIIEAIRADASRSNRAVIVDAATWVMACFPLYWRMLSGQISEAEAQMLAIQYSTQLKAIASHYDQLFGLGSGSVKPIQSAAGNPTVTANDRTNRTAVVSPARSKPPVPVLPSGMLYADEAALPDWMEES